MRRSLLTFLTIVFASVAVVAATSWIARQLCVRQLTQSANDLQWLKQEFKLSSAELERVRILHEGYLPKCESFCMQIAAKKSELEKALSDGNGVTPAAEEKIRELGALRAECQTTMLKHFQDVSAAMPPEQGRRYLREMQQLTLGHHQQFEESMFPESGTHGHH